VSFPQQQFFISSLLKENITNGVAEALRLRIARAYRHGQTFRVIIVMPLLPSFPAEKFGEKETAVLEAVLHWNYYTLSRGEDSLFGRLHKEDRIPEDEIKNYISVYGLRTHGEINWTPKSEIVYVHSKLMVVDDRITIIGSANVNDRSMTGERDSEVAIRFEDKEMIDGTMNGQPYQVGKFSHSIRVHLFKEHLGLLPSQQKGGVESPSSDISVEDPASDEFYLNTWMKAAINNTQLYKQVHSHSTMFLRLASHRVATYTLITDQLRSGGGGRGESSRDSAEDPGTCGGAPTSFPGGGRPHSRL
ncbi:Phospholipase D zeta 2, partial [Geodia barretti]